MADEADNNIKLTVEGKLYEVDIDDLELGEIEVIEDACDISVDEINWGRANAIRALVYVLKHREDSRYTMDDAKRVKVGMLGEADEPDEPTPIKQATRRPTGAVKAASSD